MSMPTTRLLARNQKSRHVPSDEESDEGVDDYDFEGQVKSLLEGVSTMKSEIKGLRRDKRRLQKELQDVREEPNLASKKRPNRQTNSRIQQLEKEVAELKKARRRDRDKLRRKEARAEAEDLQEVNLSDEESTGDRTYRMQKLLRNFSDLMLVSTLGEKEECPICWEDLVLNKCSSLVCQHILCDACLPKISVGATEMVVCPTCRGECPRDEVEHVHMTETTRWDSLLKIAQAWGAMDHRAEANTSEEENEEYFDYLDASTSSSTRGDESGVEEGEEESQEVDHDNEYGSNETPSTPPADASTSYSQSPRKVKRKVMERLAEERRLKKARIR